MTAVAVSVASRDCKTPGCAGESMHARGPYAGLCLACTAVQRKRLSDAQREAASKMTPEARSARAAVGGSTKRSGGALRDVLRDMERALVDLEKKRSVEATAMKAARAAHAARIAAEQRVAEARAALDSVIGTAAGASS